MSFPLITNITDVLPYVYANPDFSVIRKSGFIIIHYNTITTNPFNHDDPKVAAIYRECRGITFAADDGRILRRPPHKFFNYNEPAGFHIDELPPEFLIHKEDKIDGSMICPFILNDRIIYATKRGETEISGFVEDFLSRHQDGAFLESQIAISIMDFNTSPTMEFTSAKNRVVLTYEENLYPLLFRHMHTGEYDEELHEWTKTTPKEVDDMNKSVAEETGVEGYVYHVKFPDGRYDLMKMKTDWYRVRHRISTGTVRERDLAKIILEGEFDDLAPNLNESALPKATAFMEELVADYNHICSRFAKQLFPTVRKGIEKSEWARVNHKQFKIITATIFNNFEQIMDADSVEELESLLKEQLRIQWIGRTTKGLQEWEKLKFDFDIDAELDHILFTSHPEETADA